MGGNNYTDNLKNYLICKGYAEFSINKRILNLYGATYSILEIKDGKYVIQTFLLMSDDTRNSRNRFPIYKTYTQETQKGSVIYPACCIACLNNDGWHFYNASETCEPVRSCFVNYVKAKERFNTRLDIENKLTKMGKLSKHSRLAALFFILILVAEFIISREFLLNRNVVILLIASTVLFLLPDIINIIHKVSYKDVELTINAGME